MGANCNKRGEYFVARCEFLAGSLLDGRLIKATNFVVVVKTESHLLLVC